MPPVYSCSLAPNYQPRWISCYADRRGGEGGGQVLSVSIKIYVSRCLHMVCLLIHINQPFQPNAILCQRSGCQEIELDQSHTPLPLVSKDNHSHSADRLRNLVLHSKTHIILSTKDNAIMQAPWSCHGDIYQVPSLLKPFQAMPVGSLSSAFHRIQPPNHHLAHSLIRQRLVTMTTGL